jgi:D-alanine-D-alanine ligase
VSAAFKVAVVAGGPSGEAAVSRASAAGVERALRDAGHDARVLELDPALPGALAAGHFDVVFPAVHGQLGEDGCLQGLCEVTGFPYVGSGVLASALAMSKPHAKVHFERAGLLVAKDAVVTGGDDVERRARAVRAELGRSIVVKPGAGGSAIGVEIVKEGDSDDVFVAALRRALAFDSSVLVEQFKTGNDVTCSVLDDDDGGARVLAATLILPEGAAFYDFNAKYAAKGSVHRCPAPFEPTLTERIHRAAVTAHRVLGCRDLSRVDFVVDVAAGDITLLEVNTLPGMTATSLFPEAAAAAGIPFAALCDRLIRRAVARPKLAPPDVVPMPD